MCSLIPDLPRSLEAGCSLAADGASAAASPRSLKAGKGEGRAGVKGALRFCGSLATTAAKVAILLMPKSCAGLRLMRLADTA